MSVISASGNNQPGRKENKTGKAKYKLTMLGCIPFILITACVHAQLAKSSLAVDYGTSYMDSSAVSKPHSDLFNGNSYLNNLNIRASRDFVKRFDNPVNVEWTKEAKGFIVTCMLDSIKSKIAYNSSGDWVYTIKFYNEAGLPRDIRARIKSVYYDYTITQVEEIVQRIHNDPVYQVHMKDDNTWKVIWLSGKMDVGRTTHSWRRILARSIHPVY